MRIMRSGLRIVITCAAGAAGLVVIVATGLWMVGVLYYLLPWRAVVFPLLMTAIVGAEIFAMWRWRSWRAAAALYGVLFLAAFGGWALVTPRQDRDWLTECSDLPTGTITGDDVTIHNARNFTYTETGIADVRYEERHYDLRGLESVDFILSYFGSDAIAHTFLSFGFDDGEYLAVSVEIRKEKGEAFSPLAGCFKQYELMYIFGDERDLIGLRLYQRKEEVYVYRTNVTPEDGRLLLHEYIRAANELAERPAFYNTVTANCTTTIVDRLQSFWPPVPFGLDILMNGYSDRLAYGSGALDTSVPFEELRGRSRINDRMPGNAAAPDFSRVIRGEEVVAPH